MKILLIRPNSKIVRTPPPLGLLYLASYIREKEPSFDLRILDARRRRLESDAISDIIEEFNPDIIGITALHFESAQAHKIAKLVKSFNKNCVLVFGGPYASSCYEMALEDDSVDYCVVGEGEESFYELIRRVSEGKQSNDLAGVACKINGVLNFQPRLSYIKDLDSMSHPAWDMIPLEEYFDSKRLSIGNPLQVEKRAVPIFTSRGCPFGCYYCHDIFGKNVRFRSPENVLEELEGLTLKYGIKEVEIIDDVFNIDLDRAKKICELIIERQLKLKINFGNGLRADIMDEELIDKLKRAGTYRILYAIESGSPRIQSLIGKRLNLDRAKEVIEMTVKKGISVGGFFMMGFPGETREEILSTIRFAKLSRFHTASFYYVKPFPGTKLHKSINKVALNYDSQNFSSYNVLSDNLSSVSDWELKDLKRKAFREFYLNIFRIIDILKTTPNKMGLLKNAISAIRLIFKDTTAN